MCAREEPFSGAMIHRTVGVDKVKMMMTMMVMTVYRRV